MYVAVAYIKKKDILLSTDMLGKKNKQYCLLRGHINRAMLVKGAGYVYDRNK